MHNENKYTHKNKKYRTSSCFIYSMCEPFPEEKIVCSSIVLKIDVSPKIKYDGDESVYFPRYLVQTLRKSDKYYRNYRGKSYLCRRMFGSNPPLLLLYSHVIPRRVEA